MYKFDDLDKKVEEFKNSEYTKGHGLVVTSLIAATFEDGHTHILHPPKEQNKQLFINAIENIKGMKLSKSERNPNLFTHKTNQQRKESIENRKIVFSHHRALGDEVMFTAGIRDFKLLFPQIKINAEGSHKALWENNPYIDRDIKSGDNGVECYRVGYKAVNNANNCSLHFNTMFLMDMISIADLHKTLPIKLGEFTAAFANGAVGDKPELGNTKKNPNAYEPFISLAKKYKDFCNNFARQRGDLHLTEEEKNNNLIKDVYGYEKYWIIAPGGKRDCTTKIWDWRKFQEVIKHFDGKIKFVVIGKSDLLNEKLDNVIDLTDKFNKDIRGLLSLVYHADGCVSGPSALMHLAAAIPPRFKKERKPCVTILGGREPSSWTWYCNHQILHTNGIFSCCDNGGCWTARTVPLQKDKKHNKKLCRKPVKVNGRTVQDCMDSITVEDVIRAIEKYYNGDIYTYLKPEKKEKTKKARTKKDSPKVEVLADNNWIATDSREINLLGNLNTKGGGEQSLLMISELLTAAGWKVHLYPWESVEELWKDYNMEKWNFSDGSMAKNMKPGLPLLFYGNDSIRDFTRNAQEVVSKSCAVIIGINYVNDKLPKCDWLSASNKVKAIIFQNEEKRDEFERDRIGFEDTKQVVLFGAIDLERFIEVCPPERKKGQELVVLKHCMPDYRKYVTQESKSGGDKKHIWQHEVIKEDDVKFYGRLLKDTKDIKFEFMEAHKELVNAYKNESRMVFRKLNEIPVDDFLSKGHVYLYRTSNRWRDQYPRTVAEALAAGLPVLTEPRDGTKDRVVHGDTGFYCIDYDGFLYALKLLQRKEKYRHRMGMYAKEWAKKNLDPRKWVDIIERLIDE